MTELMEGVPVRKAVVAVIAATALVGGCGGESGSAQPTAERWDPCSIPADAIERTGLDPHFVKPGLGEGIGLPDWDVCRFQGPSAAPTYFVNVTSSDIHTIDDARNNPTYTSGFDLTIGDRDAFRFYTTATEPGRDCNVAISVRTGVVVFGVDFKGGIEPTRDPCDLVLQHAEDLENVLPGNEK
ncbi:DUF3558 domain-containing protein [Rhodococcus sp. G-MC3]|uniref:DUF3558 domain-containing protein n=1 Tax=Rhodococcus sp. G-MC3 TaxID=3046209 RepID=UPI0024B9E7BB|nr:DUF3558 domain-containing protein [Rhodococcus sp. G-MC3]MDJ0396034.1 DUF3558 domain-containing protein [Rhodococcus sp. G-MC3]